MINLYKNKLKKIPGEIIFTGNKKIEKAELIIINYCRDHLTEDVDDESLIEIQNLKSSEKSITWIDLRGLHNTELIKIIGNTFSIHTLILEDIADVNQRPKSEQFDNGHLIITNALKFNKITLKIEKEQISFFIREDGLLLSFQEDETDQFELIRKRLKNKLGRIRVRNVDYLAYSLLDLITDNFFQVLDDFEFSFIELEDEIVNNTNPSIKERLHHLKKELMTIRKTIVPMKDAIYQFSKSETQLIKEQTHSYFRDLIDNLTQLTDRAESYRDMLNSLQDLYLSEINLKNNQVVQLLTIITTIFVPLSFLAGLYGMNFENIPELHYKYGYYCLLAVMLLLSIGLVVFFKKKKWF